MQNFFYRLRYRLQHLQGPMDYLWLFLTVFNVYQLGDAILHGNVVGALLSGLFLFLCIQPLLR